RHASIARCRDDGSPVAADVSKGKKAGWTTTPPSFGTFGEPRSPRSLCVRSRHGEPPVYGVQLGLPCRRREDTRITLDTRRRESRNGGSPFSGEDRCASRVC